MQNKQVFPEWGVWVGAGELMLWGSLQLPGNAGVQNPVIIRFSRFGDTEATCYENPQLLLHSLGAPRFGSGPV